ncbi:MAG: hypothetical protein CVU16_11430 [Betaproteobacteria bacterium HGW-Betaproteobacteria-10]|nr:MAG: hypothetical protein CVU16_11430 [Betaproteobacteria bacterium HGW-Betaproteobacteria-10]
MLAHDFAIGALVFSIEGRQCSAWSQWRASNGEWQQSEWTGRLICICQQPATSLLLPLIRKSLCNRRDGPMQFFASALAAVVSGQ